MAAPRAQLRFRTVATMSEYAFGLYRGHLSEALVQAAETRFASDDVAVVNYTEPTGERRGWFTCRNWGHPFNQSTASEVLTWALQWARDHRSARDIHILEEREQR